MAIASTAGIIGFQFNIVSIGGGGPDSVDVQALQIVTDAVSGDLRSARRLSLRYDKEKQNHIQALEYRLNYVRYRVRRHYSLHISINIELDREYRILRLPVEKQIQWATLR